MSTFEQKAPFKKRIVSASLTEEQRAEFDQIKAALELTSDGAVLKTALAALSHGVLGPIEPKSYAELLVPTDWLKIMRETLCLAQQALIKTTAGHLARIQHLINEIDRHRALGADGKHGDMHTPTCGCEDA